MESVSQNLDLLQKLQIGGADQLTVTSLKEIKTNPASLTQEAMVVNFDLGPDDQKILAFRIEQMSFRLGQERAKGSPFLPTHQVELVIDGMVSPDYDASQEGHAKELFIRFSPDDNVSQEQLFVNAHQGVTFTHQDSSELKGGQNANIVKFKLDQPIELNGKKIKIWDVALVIPIK